MTRLDYLALFCVVGCALAALVFLGVRETRLERACQLRRCEHGAAMWTSRGCLCGYPIRPEEP